MIISVNDSHFVKKICQVLTILHQLICRVSLILGHGIYFAARKLTWSVEKVTLKSSWLIYYAFLSQILPSNRQFILGLHVCTEFGKVMLKFNESEFIFN